MVTEITIDASELKGEGDDVIKALADFVKEKTSAEVNADGKKMVVKGIFDRYNSVHDKKNASRFHLGCFGQAQIPREHRFGSQGHEEYGVEPVGRRQRMFPPPRQRL